LRFDENGIQASVALVARLRYVARVGLPAAIYFVAAKLSLLLLAVIGTVLIGGLVLSAAVGERTRAPIS
jgi:hypothetical protein